VIGDIRAWPHDRRRVRPGSFDEGAAKALATKLVNNAYQNGLLLLECGASGIRLIPPLMIDQGLLDEGLDILELSLRSAGVRWMGRVCFPSQQENDLSLLR